MAERLGMDPRNVASMPSDLFDEGVAWFNTILPQIQEEAKRKAKSSLQ